MYPFINDILPFLKYAAAALAGLLGKVFLDKVTRQGLYSQMTKSMTAQQREITDLRTELTEYVSKMNAFHIENGNLRYEIQTLNNNNNNCLDRIREIESDNQNCAQRIGELQKLLNKLSEDANNKNESK